MLVLRINFAHLCDARIVFHLEHEAVHLVLALQLLLALLRILVHGAELIDLEEAAVLSHTLLCEKQRSRRFDQKRRR